MCCGRERVATLFRVDWPAGQFERARQYIGPVDDLSQDLSRARCRGLDIDRRRARWGARGVGAATSRSACAQPLRRLWRGFRRRAGHVLVRAHRWACSPGGEPKRHWKCLRAVAGASGRPHGSLWRRKPWRARQRRWSQSSASAARRSARRPALRRPAPSLAPWGKACAARAKSSGQKRHIDRAPTTRALRDWPPLG